MLAKFRKNKKRINNFFSNIFYIFSGIIVLLIMGLLIIGNIRVNEKRNELNAKIRFLEEQIQELQEKEDLFKSQILDTSKDEYLEGKARDIFDLQKEGEKAVIIKEK